MQSKWSASDAEAWVRKYAERGVQDDLALRTYSARLIGVVPELVMHGGGNTSVKTTMRDIDGADVEVLCIKGSGWDLATIEPQGHPAVLLQPLRRLRALSALSDEDMVNIQRRCLLDSSAPNPSVEALLHAYLPHKFIDHTHAVAACAVTDQPDAEAVCREIWGDRLAVVPYIMPGFALAKRAAEIFERHPHVEGLVLLKHGVVTFGSTAEEGYRRMIEFVGMAEDYIRSKAGDVAPISLPGRSAGPASQPPEQVLPALRGLLDRSGESAGDRAGWILDARMTDDLRKLLARPDLADLSRRGVSTPDHVIRTKGWPALLPDPGEGREDWVERAADAVAAYVGQYRAYFDRNNQRAAAAKKMLDPLPRLFLCPGIGLIGAGRSAAEARIVADLGEAWCATALRAEAIGRFEPVPESDLFDMEYWSLEQAKLGKGRRPALSGRVAVITGGAGAIGLATAQAFLALGAEVAVIDRDADGLARAAAACGGKVMTRACDVTDRAAVDAAFGAVCAQYGGLDYLVSNAGAAMTGAMSDLSEAVLRQSFEINFFSHQHAAQAAIRILRRQKSPGCLLFNVSKQALNPGEKFGAYGTSKSALMALVRQYALEHGPEGVRVNAVNPDRIRSGLLTPAMISARAAARAVDEAEYMAGNLLHAEVRADDVAQAFVSLVQLERTTGCILTVDGGNVAAMPR